MVTMAPRSEPNRPTPMTSRARRGYLGVFGLQVAVAIRVSVAIPVSATQGLGVLIARRIGISRFIRGGGVCRCGRRTSRHLSVAMWVASVLAYFR